MRANNKGMREEVVRGGGRYKDWKMRLIGCASIAMKGVEG